MWWTQEIGHDSIRPWYPMIPTIACSGIDVTRGATKEHANNFRSSGLQPGHPKCQGGRGVLFVADLPAVQPAIPKRHTDEIHYRRTWHHHTFKMNVADNSGAASLVVLTDRALLTGCACPVMVPWWSLLGEDLKTGRVGTARHKAQSSNVSTKAITPIKYISTTMLFFRSKRPNDSRFYTHIARHG